MRAVWVDEGQDPDYGKLAANGINWPYFALRDPRLSAPYLTSVAAHTGIDGCGVYAVASWFPTAGPVTFAEWVDARLRAIGWLGNAPVMLDIEVSDLAAYTVACLTRWRQIRPARVTDLTIEGHKGGVFQPVDVIHVSAKVRYVVPQCYNGSMTQVWDSYAMVCDLAAAGFPLGKLCPFYDAAHLSQWWGLPAGYAFTQGRLP
jgi:hypothetical protein